MLFRSMQFPYSESDDYPRHDMLMEVTLAGSFCIGKCNRIGVTVQVDDEIHTGITRENFKEFFTENVLNKIQSERK